MITKVKEIDNKTNSLAYTKWLFKYHIVLTANYRRRIIYNHYQTIIQGLIKRLFKYNGVEILQVQIIPDNIHLLLCTQKNECV
nr:transposase [Enterococcus sp. DIV1094]